MTREDDGPRFPDDAVDISMCAEFGQIILDVGWEIHHR